jgi:dihydrofolate reductase
MEAGLIKKMYLTIESIIFGKGIPLFNTPFQHKLKLVANTQINENTLLLEYDVIN